MKHHVNTNILLNIRHCKITYDELSSIDFSLNEKNILENLKEDLLQAEIGSNLTLDIGWYPSFKKKGSFTIQLIENFDWEKPILKRKTKDWNELNNILIEFVDSFDQVKI